MHFMSIWISVFSPGASDALKPAGSSACNPGSLIKTCGLPGTGERASTPAGPLSRKGLISGRKYLLIRFKGTR